MYEQVRACDAGFEGAGSERRVSLRAAVGVRDGREISARDLLTIDVASQQVLDAGAVGSRRTAASMSAIWAGNKSRNKPEIRQVTSTRGRPALAVGRTSTPVTRPVA